MSLTALEKDFFGNQSLWFLKFVFFFKFLNEVQNSKALQVTSDYIFKPAAHRKPQVGKYAGPIHVSGMAVIIFSLIHKARLSSRKQKYLPTSQGIGN
jgi:hypothetical protein